MAVCTIRMVNEVTCSVTGLREDHVAKLVDMQSEYVPGFKYMPLFKMKAWDGKTQFFTKKGRTYQSLLPELAPLLTSWGYKIRLVDERPPIEIDVPLATSEIFAEYGIHLREHQIEAVNAVINADHKGLILACTGAGKSYMLAALSKTYECIGFRSIVIVPSRDLITQMVETYEKIGLDVGAYSGTEKDTDHQHVISTWQALQNNPALLQTFQVVMFDEAQGLKSKVVMSLLAEHGNMIPVRIGCTGTLPKEAADYKSIFAALGGGVVYTITAAELQKRNLLATCQIIQMILQDTANPAEDVFAEYDHEKQALIINKQRNKWIADFLVDLAAEKGNTLILVSSIKVGNALQKMIGDEKSVFIYGKDKDVVRKKVYNSFEHNNNLIVIANVQIAAVGLSIDRIFNLVLIDIGKAFTRVIQAIGRALRMAADKTHADIYDIGTNYSFGAHHARKRREYYIEASYPVKRATVQYK